MTRVALKGLTQRPLRTLLTTLAIVLGVALVSASFTITDTQKSAADALSSAAYDGTDAVISAKTAFDLDTWEKRPTVPASLLEEVRADTGVEVAVGNVDDDAYIIGGDGKPRGQGPYFGVGFDAGTPGAEKLTPFRLDSGDWAAGPGEVVIDSKTSEEEGLGIGDRVEIATRGGSREFEITGVARFGTVKALGPATAAVFDLETAQALFEKRGAYDSILVAGDPGDVGPRYSVQSASEHDRFDLGGLDQFISVIRVVLLVFGLVAVLVGAFTILNTLSITVAQRTREFGLLRMVGATKRQVRVSVLVEALVLGLVASAVGTAGGLLLAEGLSGVFAALGLDLPDAGTVFATRTAVVAMAVGVGATLVAGLIPARRATRIAPVAALRDGAAGDRAPGFVARMIRPAVGLIGRPAERVGGSAGQLARRNAMRAPGRTAATAAALVVGVALTTAVTVVATGLKDEARGSISDRVTAEYVVVGADGWSPIDPQIESRLAASDGVELATSVRGGVGQAFGDEEYLNAVDPAAIAQVFDFDWVSGSSATFAELGRDGAIVDEGWATEHGLKVGSRFELTAPSGEELSLTVKGVERSSVIDVLAFGPITIALDTFEAAEFPVDRNRMTFVDAGSEAALAGVMDGFPEAEAQTTGAYADKQAASVDQLLAIFGVLLALSVLVSLFGIVNALVLATFERTRELGTLRALGMSRRQMRRMVRHESVITALLGASGGIAAGLGIAAIVTSVFAEEGLTFVVPVPMLAVFVVVASLAGVLAAVLPARRAARLDPLSALAYE